MARKPKSTAASAKGSFTYLGPNTGFDDVLLVKGRTYPNLPESHPVVAGLIGRKLLVPAALEAPAEPADEPFTGDEY